MSNLFQFTKTKDVKTPQRDEKAKDSGFDFFIPNKIEEIKNPKRDENGKLTFNFCYTPISSLNEDTQKNLQILNIKKTENQDEDGNDIYSINIPSGLGIIIPTGIKILLGEGGKDEHGEYTFDMVLQNKSGVAMKKNLIVGAQVIDNQYRGECHIHLINNSKFDITVNTGDKITQGIIRKVYLTQPKEITNEEYLKHSKTTRGEGGFGSTGSK